jgi:hypothetical protein
LKVEKFDASVLLLQDAILVRIALAADCTPRLVRELEAAIEAVASIDPPVAAALASGGVL